MAKKHTEPIQILTVVEMKKEIRYLFLGILFYSLSQKWNYSTIFRSFWAPLYTRIEVMRMHENQSWIISCLCWAVANKIEFEFRLHYIYYLLFQVSYNWIFSVLSSCEPNYCAHTLRLRYLLYSKACMKSKKEWMEKSKWAFLLLCFIVLKINTYELYMHRVGSEAILLLPLLILSLTNSNSNQIQNSNLFWARLFFLLLLIFRWGHRFQSIYFNLMPSQRSISDCLGLIWWEPKMDGLTYNDLS